jgi:hypothetical protein
MKLIIPLLILVTTCTANAAPDRQPYAVYGPNQSCLYTFVGNETFITCDESATHIRNLYDKETLPEKQRIIRQEYDERLDREEREWRARRKIEREQEAKEEREDKEAKLYAENPKGWSCVQKHLSVGLSILQPPDSALRACKKAFNSKP